MERALACVREARRFCPEYGSGLAWSRSECFQTLMAGLGVRAAVHDLEDVATVLMPVRGGSKFRLILSDRLNRQTRNTYVLRHELGHVLAGDADEPCDFQFEHPLPQAEMVADLFAFVDLIGDFDFQLGLEWVAAKMRASVVIDYEPWYLRIPRILDPLRELRERLRRAENEFVDRTLLHKGGA